MRVMIVAGEASGDLHGSHLVRQILRLRPGVRFFGVGGRLMAEAGVDILHDVTRQSVIGFTEALKSVRPLRRVQEQLALLLEEERPDVFVPIDFPSFNLKLAAKARMLRIPVVYYFSPSTWAWGAKRAELVANAGMNVCSVFPFEAEVYRKAGANVIYVGHPLLDIVKTDLETEKARELLGLPSGGPVLALLPGSRTQEIRRLLRPMVSAFELLRAEMPDLVGVVPAAHTTPVSSLEELIGDAPIHIVEGQTHAALRAADAAVITSGTATLEAAILGTPQVMVYKLSSVSYGIAKRLVRIRHVALPNIVAGKEIVKELLQDAVTPQAIADAVRPLFHDAEAVRRMRQDYADVVRRLGRQGAVERAAKVVLAAAEQELVDPEKYALREA
ncbi:MAG: lipid-A-disaccharide synthase [Firmicutes bacterium]|nr:lipid-A-disaccharide synthase [Bacillota bacterium]